MTSLSKIGISASTSKLPGLGGLVKKTPGDFIVQELNAEKEPCSLTPSSFELFPDKPPQDPAHEYVHFTMVKRDWHQDILLTKIARLCGVSRKRLTYAGTKDKFALTAQRIAAWKIPTGKIANIKIKDCTLGDFSYADHKLGLGDLWGNRFTIQIHDVKHPENLDPLLDEFKTLGGSPNFFGPQRFGSRLNNHRVGKAILQGNIEEAIKIFLADGSELEKLEEGRAARLALKENWGDFAEALKTFPRYARFETALLNHLVQHPQDFVGAFKKLSKNMYKLFTHAYQSYLFNQLLSQRIDRGQSLEGEGRLLGYTTENLTAEEEALLKTEGLELKDFKVKSFPEASVRGQTRSWLAGLTIHDYKMHSDTLTISFDLEKGAYATIFLQELLKP